jgi:hypothetical protein
VRWTGGDLDRPPWTDADKPDRWYSYPLCGDPVLTVPVADNPGDGVVSFRFAGSIDPSWRLAWRQRSGPTPTSARRAGVLGFAHGSGVQVFLLR